MTPTASAWLVCVALFGAATARGDDLPSRHELPAPTEKAEDPPLARLVERVTVTATATPLRLAETPGSLVALGPEVLAATASPTLDDALRQVPGFSLFRRTGSRTANPTAQGVSLRGLGASGASRALVLVDGQPINDPFGGWVYWGRVPRDSVESIEVLRGGGSALYGSSALGGVVQLLTHSLPARPELRAEASAGSLGTLDGSLNASGRRGAWGSRVVAAGFRTDGYAPVEGSRRGAVDGEVESRHGVFEARIERAVAASGRVFARGALFAESRGNGTPLQVNATHVRDGLLGADWSSPRLGSLRARLDLGSQVFTQSFSAVAADRSRETLTRRQRVPARTAGLSMLGTRALGGRHLLLLGFDRRHVKGASDELAFAAGLPSAEVDSGGRVLTTSVCAEDLFRATPRLLLVAAARLDHWRHADGFRQSRPRSGSTAPSSTAFPDRSEMSLSPRASALFRFSPSFAVTASAYGAFRGPTLNELYRSFRLGDTLTLANERLAAERLVGGEAGARWAVPSGRLGARVTAFSSEVDDAVANLTLSVTPGLVTRQRQNLGRIRSRGLEAELEARPTAGLWLAAGYALTDARVRRFPTNPALEGLRLPQVPQHQVTLQARYQPGERVSVAAQARWAGAQFEDDQNRLRLAPVFHLDAQVVHAIGHGLEAFVAAENLLGARAEVGLVAVRTLGPPFTVRTGLRYRPPPPSPR